MIAAFHFTAWYAWAAYFGAGYLLWSGVAETGHRHLRWLRRKLRGASSPEADHPAATPTQLTSSERDPYVALGHPSAQVSVTPLTELGDGEHRRLTRVEPTYLIENKEPAVAIRDVTTGVRTRDGREHRFDAFYAGLIGPREQAQVANVGSIPTELLDGVHESEGPTAFMYWARFTLEGSRWEVAHDPQTRRDTYRRLPPLDAKLDARMINHGGGNYRLAIRNVGSVTVEQVECVLPPEATNWHLLTDVLPHYPITALDPGDDLEVVVAVTMGGPAAIDITVQGVVEGVPYSRRRTLTL
jgi:hypothetical protein